MKQRRYPEAQLGGLIVVVAFALLWFAERKKPLRRSVESAARRQTRNAVVAALAAATVQIVEMPLIGPLATLVELRRWGVCGRLPPGWIRAFVSIVALDYTLYFWHILVHRVPILWRFHAVHHVDRDLDASTAVRFHFGELALSVPWRAAQIIAIGVSSRDLRVWQRALLVSILFHHSNVQLPERVERVLSAVVVTPRLHGIHHANVKPIRDTNWSSGLTFWDRIHGTLRTDVPQPAITIGVEGYDRREDVTLTRILALPFTAPPPAVT
jgi:sterol desaturase/sphingolipid hydroxylase (fatty acid hydroxylase superfamily)